MLAKRGAKLDTGSDSEGVAERTLDLGTGAGEKLLADPMEGHFRFALLISNPDEGMGRDGEQ